MRRLKRMWYRGAPWLCVLAIGVVTFGFHAFGGFPGQDQMSPALRTAGATRGITPTPEPKWWTPEGTGSLVDEGGTLPTGDGGGAVITCSADKEIVPGNSIACESGGITTDNEFARCFDAANFPVATTVLSLDFGVEIAEQVASPIEVIGTLYSIAACGAVLPDTDLTVLGSGSITLVGDGSEDGTIQTISFGGGIAVPAGTNVVAEIAYGPDNRLWPGSNPNGQACLSYISSDSCGLFDLTDLAAIGFPDMHLILNLNVAVGEPCDKTVLVEIFSDDYPGETSWELVDKGTGEVVASGAPTDPNALHRWNVCITDTDCYNFTIFDSFGDGICCAYGNGYYNVFHDGELECSGGDFGESETCSDIGWGCGVIPAIVGSDPPDGAIDAGIPSDATDCAELFGWDEILIEFDGDASGVGAADFTITVDPADEAPPGIDSVEYPAANTVKLLLDARIPPGHWTVFTHDPSGTWTRLGYLPGDVNSSKQSNSADVLDLIDFLNGVPPPLEIWQVDVNRSGVANSADILDEIDVLNGAGPCWDPWNGETLP